MKALGAARRVGLGLRARKGGAVIVAIALEGDRPRLLLSSFLKTCAEDDRLSLEPYRVAAEMTRSPSGGASVEAAAAVAEGRRRQREIAASGLRAVIETQRDAGLAPDVCGMLVNRAGWVSDLLEYSLEWPEHIVVAEGLAVREALRFALRQCGLDAIELDEKSLPELAASSLCLSSAEMDASLKEMGRAAGRPWRKEQKNACLAAWIAIGRSVAGPG